MSKFLDEKGLQTLVNNITVRKGDGENSVRGIHSHTISDDSVALGLDTYAGGKMFRIMTHSTDDINIVISINADLETITEIKNFRYPDYAHSNDTTLYLHIYNYTQDLVYYRQAKLDNTATTDADPGNDWYSISEEGVATLILTNTIGELGDFHNGLDPTDELYLIVNHGPQFGDTVWGDRSFATNQDNKAIGTRSVALGRNNISASNTSVSLGHTNNVFGKYGMALGVYNRVFASTGVAIGRSCTVYPDALYGVALGQGGIAKGERAVAIHGTASGYGSVAVGEGVKANGKNSVAMGYKVIANDYQTVFGKYNKDTVAPASATSTDSGAIFIVGNGDSATDSGRKNGFVMTANSGFQLGTTATLNGANSIVGGYNSQTIGESSVALGRGLTAGPYQTVVGKYNVQLKAPSTYEGQGSDEAIFIVGTGRGATTSGKKNGLVVWGDGHASISKAPISDMDVANKKYVDDTVAELVNSAPSTLNTLNELAAALGDDPNFATTITNQLANKVDKVSGKGLSTNDYTDIDSEVISTIRSGYVLGPSEYSFGESIPVESKYGATLIGFDAIGDSIRCSECDTVITIPEEIKSLNGYGLEVGKEDDDKKYNYIDLINNQIHKKILTYEGSTAEYRATSTNESGGYIYSIDVPLFNLSGLIPAKFILNDTEFEYDTTCSSLSTSRKCAPNKFRLLNNGTKVYFCTAEQLEWLTESINIAAADYEFIYQPEIPVVETFVSTMKTSIELAEGDVINNYDVDGNIISKAINGKVVVTEPVAVNDVVDKIEEITDRVSILDSDISYVATEYVQNHYNTDNSVYYIRVVNGTPDTLEDGVLTIVLED